MTAFGAACLTLLAVAAWSVSALVEGRQNAFAQQIAQDEYESQLQSQYAQNGHLPVGNAGELFARMR